MYIHRGVKQGSVLSPTLFLTVMELLLKRTRESDGGTSIRGIFCGATIQADDLHTTATTRDEVLDQVAVIESFPD